ncbi:MAG TPA: RsbRD N-terminal domain-containing protein [Nitrospirota bacterium]|nr:RsbRD N-terminal domain-containing protein [Nitrospirota bacterium]
MNFKELLNEKKPDILKLWFEAVCTTYPEETAAVLKKKKAQFTNPVGYTLTDGLEHLFDALQKGMMPDTVSRFLDSIVRLRAIQDFAPSEAVSFIFQLKKIVRTAVGPELLQQHATAAELEAFDSSVDDLALFAFDLYMKCREKIYDLKANEARNMTFRLLQQARLIVDNQD